MMVKGFIAKTVSNGLLIFIAFLSSSVCVGKSPEHFFSKPDMVSAKLNPQGNVIAAIDYKDDVQRLVVIDVPNKSTNKSDLQQRRVLLDIEKFTEKEASLRWISWIDDQHIAVLFSQMKKGIKDLIDTKHASYILIVKVPNMQLAKQDFASAVKIYSIRTRGALIHSLPNEKDAFLFAKGGIRSKVYKLKVSLLNEYGKKAGKLTKTDGGQFIKDNEVASIDGFAVRWFIDRGGEVKAVLSYDNERNLLLSEFSESEDSQGDEKELLHKWTRKELDNANKQQEDADANHNASKLLIPIMLAADQGSFYCLDITEEERRSVYRYDFINDEEDLVYESDSYRILDLFQSRESNDLIAVSVLKDGDIRHVYLDREDEEKVRPAGVYSSLISESASQAVQLFYSESHNFPGRYELRYRGNNKALPFGRILPAIDEALSSQLIQGVVEVEGLEIPYLLNLPLGDAAKKQPMPLLVMPHGGPIGVYDSPFFDSAVQLFSANGYAVLRVNYRGSSGHSQALREAGKKQWGGLILQDIHKTAQHVIARDDIDQNKVCLFGMSYGGYASVALLATYPESYRCGVNVSGVSDINLYLNSPYMNSRQRAWTRDYIGDPVKNYDALKKQSPVYMIRELEKPLLIMHGEKDEVVSVEHAYRLKRALEKYGKTFEWQTFPEMGHNFEEYEQAVRLYEKALSFINKHLL